MSTATIEGLGTVHTRRHMDDGKGDWPVALFVRGNNRLSGGGGGGRE